MHSGKTGEDVRKETVLRFAKLSMAAKRAQ